MSKFYALLDSDKNIVVLLILLHILPHKSTRVTPESETITVDVHLPGAFGATVDRAVSLINVLKKQ